MTYHVDLSTRAVRDLEQLYIAKNAAESAAAAKWFNGLEEAVMSLSSHPYRCPVAPESRKLRRKLWHLLYGKKRHVYRVIFEVDDSQATVWGVTIRHGARRQIKKTEIES